MKYNKKNDATMNKMRFVWFSILGLFLLAPASYFMFALSLRAFAGVHRFYDGIAPHFLEATWSEFTLEKAAWILYGPLLAVILNLALILRVSVQRRSSNLDLSVKYRGHWMNAAVMLQGVILSIALLAYLVIEHIRY
jgi:hypothetical protein